ncbi:unnamed protein product [Meloidogyne enterolobii]|uniref:Uncharacterized protein n=1 Tax=Meloidogyne enterolobii TaxID=390850 RepID=A0ACB0ZEE9_MELEN
MFILPKPFYLLILLIISTIFLLFLIFRLPSISYQTNQCQHLWDSSNCKNLNNSLNWHPITCFIDGKQKRVSCLQQNDLKEVYLPFNSFLKKQFDLYGETDKSISLIFKLIFNKFCGQSAKYLRTNNFFVRLFCGLSTIVWSKF